MIYSYAQCYGLRYLVFRFSNVYGRYDNDLERMERVIPKFIGQISRGDPIIIYGQDKVLDFTYVDDCVSGVMSGLHLLAGGHDANQTINLAYGQGSTLVEMAKHVGQAVGVEPDIQLAPSRVGEVTHYVANVGKARALLNYHPQTPLSIGIPKAVEWCLDWWANHAAAGT